MIQQYQSYKIREVKRLRNNYIQTLSQLKNLVPQIENIVECIDIAIEKSGGVDENAVVMVPCLLLQDDSITGRFEWKKQVQRVIVEAKTGVTIKSIYELLKIDFPLELCDERKAIKAISATLIALETDGVVTKLKKPEARAHTYNLSEYSQLKLRNEPFEKILMRSQTA
jgi:hypothetical protein